MEVILRTAATSARVISRPVLSPPAWTIRWRLCAASRPTRKRPAPVRSNGTPRRTSSSIAAGPPAMICSTTGCTQRPSPAASVSANLQRDIVVIADASRNAALREDARRIFADRAAAQHNTRFGGKLQRRHQPGDTAADDQHTPFEIANVHRLCLNKLPTCVRPKAAPAPRSPDRSPPRAASSPANGGCSTA